MSFVLTQTLKLVVFSHIFGPTKQAADDCSPTKDMALRLRVLLERRARVQPCHTGRPSVRALAPGVRFFEGYGL